MIFGLIGSNVIMALVFLLNYKSLPPQIPLFYSQKPGEDQLGEWWMIFLLPFFLNLFVLLNKVICGKFFRGNDFVEKIFHYMNIFMIVSFTLVFIKIILLIS